MLDSFSIAYPLFAEIPVFYCTQRPFAIEHSFFFNLVLIDTHASCTIGEYGFCPGTGYRGEHDRPAFHGVSCFMAAYGEWRRKDDYSGKKYVYLFVMVNFM